MSWQDNTTQLLLEAVEPENASAPGVCWSATTTLILIQGRQKRRYTIMSSSETRYPT